VLKILYWAAVVAISFVLVLGLILFLESRDESSLDGATTVPALTSAV